jgi:hypothetical protein
MEIDLSQYNEAQLSEWYINNRNWLSDRKKEYEAAIADVEATQDAIEAECQRRLNEAGATSFRTTGGTIVQSIRITYTAEDRAAFGQYIVQSGNYEATTIKPTKEFVEDYSREHNGQLPPGVASYSQAVISIKKPTSK